MLGVGMRSGSALPVHINMMKNIPIAGIFALLVKMFVI